MMGDLTNWLGVLFQTGTIIGAGAAYLNKMNINLRLLAQEHSQVKNQILKIETRVEGMSTLLTELAKQDARLNYLEARILDLSTLVTAHIKKESS